MAKNKRHNKDPKSGSQAPPSPTVSPIVKENGRVVTLTVAAVVLSIVISVPFLSPLLLTAPIVRPLIRRIRSGDVGNTDGAFLRWAITLFVSILVSAAFVRDRMVASFPFASDAARVAELTLAGIDGPPAGFVYLVVGIVAFVVLAAASLGIAACLLGSIALAVSAVVASVIYAYGTNVVLITLVAIPPWQWALFAASTLAFTPATILGGSRFYGIDAGSVAWEGLKRRSMIIAGLIVLSVVLRLALAGPYVSLVRNWTVF
jgi:hypothetical protein